MSMPKHSQTLARELRCIHMDSDADVWSLTLNGYMIGAPDTRERIVWAKEWLEGGALREIENLFREGGRSNG